MNLRHAVALALILCSCSTSCALAPPPVMHVTYRALGEGEGRVLYNTCDGDDVNSVENLPWQYDCYAPGDGTRHSLNLFATSVPLTGQVTAEILIDGQTVKQETGSSVHVVY
jgi:hypothetical protein